MNRFFTLLVAALFCFNAFADDVVTAKVSGTNLNIGLVNETSFVAFQMDIKLPIGASAVVEKTGRLAQGDDVQINNIVTPTPFVIANNILEDNVLRVVGYNLGNNEILDASGDILTISLSVAPTNVEDIKVTNIKFVTKDELKEISFADVAGENGAIPGDVVAGGGIMVNDVTAAIKILLTDSVQQRAFAKANGYIFEAADVDGNGEVMINDVLNIIKLFLAQ